MLSACTLATGFPSGRNYATQSLDSFVKQVQEFKKLRLLGTAALSLAYVAEGVLDSYFEEGIMLWDVAAGVAICKAAGAKVDLVESNERMWATTTIVSGPQSCFDYLNKK